jgi:riboflavin biosynthesis pyrimidine reductase
VSELAPLECLFERSDLPRAELPARLRELYGGDLGLPGDCLFANFVSTLDGVVSIPSLVRSNRVLSDESEADLFVMALLRAFASAVLVGSGTLRASPTARWRAETAFPGAKDELAELRSSLGFEAAPEIAVVSASGSIDESHPAVRDGALVLTTERGAELLPDGVRHEVLPGEGHVDLRAAVELLRSHGHRRILTEGGPTVFGALVAAGLVDELFLTVSPLLAGRSDREDQLGLVERMQFLPDRRVGGTLLSLRAHGDHLFLRYALPPA